MFLRINKMLKRYINGKLPYFYIKIVLLFLLISIFNRSLASDHVDPSEYMDIDDKDSSYSLLPILAIIGLIYAMYRMFDFFKYASGKITHFDKIIVFICGISMLFLAIGFFNVPYNYFIFLRYVISIGSIICLIHEIPNSKEHHWKIYFLVILLLHNPIYPIHLFYKTIWLILDFIIGVIFFAKISTIIEKANQK